MQGSLLGPVLYILHTNDIPILKNNKIATVADYTEIMALQQLSAIDTVENI